MAVRKRIARTVGDITGTDYKEVLKKAKLRYKINKEFYLFKAYKGSDFWCAQSYLENPDRADEYWKFNEKNKRWEINSIKQK